MVLPLLVMNIYVYFSWRSSNNFVIAVRNLGIDSTDILPTLAGSPPDEGTLPCEVLPHPR